MRAKDFAAGNCFPEVAWGEPPGTWPRAGRLAAKVSQPVCSQTWAPARAASTLGHKRKAKSGSSASEVSGRCSRRRPLGHRPNGGSVLGRLATERHDGERPPQSSEVAPTVSGPAPLCASASHEQSSKELRVGTMLFIPGVSGRQIASVGEGAVGRIFLLASPEVRGGSVPRPRARTAGLKTRRSAGEHFTGTGRVSS